MGPLFSKATRSGDRALISCAISQPLEQTHIASDVSEQVIRQAAQQDLAAHQPGFKLLSEAERHLADHNAYQITWESVQDGKAWRHQSIFLLRPA